MIETTKMEEDNGRTVINALFNGQYAGSIVIVEEAPESFFVTGINVAKEYRGVGVGYELLHAGCVHVGCDLTIEEMPDGSIIVGGKVRTTPLKDENARSFLLTQIERIRQEGDVPVRSMPTDTSYIDKVRSSQ